FARSMNMDEVVASTGLLLCAFAYYDYVYIKSKKQIKKKWRKRRWWMTSIHRNRTSLTMEQQLNELVAESSREFKKFTRMSKADFEYLLNKVSPLIAKQDTQLRKAVPAKILAITLRYLASGDDFESLHFLFKVSPQLISQIIPEVCRALNKVLKDKIKFIHGSHLICVPSTCTSCAEEVAETFLVRLIVPDVRKDETACAYSLPKTTMRPHIRKAVATTAFLIILRLAKKRNHKTKRFCIKLLYKNRLQDGNRLFEELCFDDKEKKFTRMSKIEFDNVYSLINAKKSKKDTNFREAISARERLLVTLRFLASGDSYTSLQYLFRILKQRISVIVPEVCDAIIEVKRRRIQNHRRPIHRGHWVHPILTSRNKNGQHKLLFEELKCYPDKFFKYFRMSVNSFNELLSVLHDDLKHQDTRMRKSISPTERLAITLRYLATGCSFGDFELVYRCGASTARLIYYRSVYRHKVIKKKWRKRRWWMLTIHRNRTRVFKRPIPLDVVKTSIITHSCLLLHNFLRKSKSSRNIYTPPGSTDSYDRNGELIRVGMRVNHEENLLPLQSVPRRPPINATQIRSNFMNYIHQIVIYILIRKKYKRKKTRRFWVRPSLQNRKWQNGTVMMEEYKKDNVGCQRLRNSMFFGFLRMTYEDFKFLLASTEEYISKKNTGWRKPIPAKERLAVTLRFLATGESYFSLGERFKISPQLLSSLIPEVCQAIISKLQIKYYRSVYRHKVIKKKLRKRRWWMLTIHRNRTRVFKRPIPLDVVKTSIITHSCLLLHNFLRKSKSSRNIYTPPGSTDSYDRNGELIRVGMRVNHEENLLPLQSVPRRPPINATQIRSNFMNYIHQSRLCSGRAYDA
ncbi:hypothetical protein HW555_005078, partial [Spodoptera exigua]